MPELDSTDELRTVFNPENFKLEIYDHFFKTLSWILYDISHEYEAMYEVLDKVKNFIKEQKFYNTFLDWLYDRIEILRIELSYFRYTNQWLRKKHSADASFD